ncbi:MAG: LPXTG cell wall anchor domain-containing protein, partial [Coriobacteriales bacterium]|nr:LPXTG cell wall anchor domain-containing protein [Coriobacteriales bacterium]
AWPVKVTVQSTGINSSLQAVDNPLATCTVLYASAYNGSNGTAGDYPPNTSGMSPATASTSGIQVLNNTGTELPSTGGMGTTIFYIVGGILVAGSIVLFISKKRLASEA